MPQTQPGYDFQGNRTSYYYMDGLPIGECFAWSTYRGLKIKCDGKGNTEKILDEQIETIDNVYMQHVLEPMDCIKYKENRENIMWLESEQKALHKQCDIYI